MKIKIDGTEIEFDGTASYDVKAGTISFVSDITNNMLLIEGPEKPKREYTKKAINPSNSLTKSAVKSKVLKLIDESDDGIVTSQFITYTILGKSSSAGDKVYLRRIMSDLVSEGVLVTEKRNERAIFKLG
jgi:hypothetical protein